MNQKTMQLFESDCGKAQIYVENDMPIGVFHDFLMMMKGCMVDRMIEAHKQEQEVSETQKQESDCAEESCCKE